MANRGVLPVLVYWGGRIVMNGTSPDFEGGHNRVVPVSSSSAFTSFLNLLHGVTGYSHREYNLRLTCRWPISQVSYVSVNIIDDSSLQLMLGLYEKGYTPQVFVERDTALLVPQHRDGPAEFSGGFVSTSDANRPPCGVKELPPSDTIHSSYDPCSRPQSSQNIAPCTPGDGPTITPDVPRCATWYSQYEPNDGAGPCRTSGQYTEGPSRPVGQDEVGLSRAVDLDVAGPCRAVLEEGLGPDDSDGNVEGDCGHLSNTSVGGANGLQNITTVIANDDGRLIDERLDQADHTVMKEVPYDAMVEAGGVIAWLGRIFDSKELLHNALAEWSIANSVQFYTLRSTKTTYTVRCTEPNCQWRVHASVPKGRSHFRINSYSGDHSCFNQVIADHRQCTSGYICSLILPALKANLTMSPAEIQERVKAELHIDIPYMKAWMARNKALKIICGRERSYGDPSASQLPSSEVVARGETAASQPEPKLEPGGDDGIVTTTPMVLTEPELTALTQPEELHPEAEDEEIQPDSEVGAEDVGEVPDDDSRDLGQGHGGGGRKKKQRTYLRLM